MLNDDTELAAAERRGYERAIADLRDTGGRRAATTLLFGLAEDITGRAIAFGMANYLEGLLNE